MLLYSEWLTNRCVLSRRLACEARPGGNHNDERYRPVHAGHQPELLRLGDAFIDDHKDALRGASVPRRLSLQRCPTPRRLDHLEDRCAGGLGILLGVQQREMRRLANNLLNTVGRKRG